MGRRRAQHGVWPVAESTTIALGLVCAVVVWGFWGPVAIAFGVFVPAFVLSVLVGKSAWTSTRIGFDFGVVLVSCAGLLGAFGWSGALLVLLVGLTSPLVRIVLPTGWMNAVMGQAVPEDTAAVRDDGGSLEGTTGGSSRTLLPLAEMPNADGVPRLDDHALCQAWRHSYVRLEASRTADARLEVVRLRQLYLDELVRRHPAEVRHWLESGARAAGNPHPFLERPVFQEGPSEQGEHGPGPRGRLGRRQCRLIRVTLEGGPSVSMARKGGAMTAQVRSTSKSLEPSFGRALLGAVFAMFCLTAVFSLVFGAALLLLARSVTSASF